MTTGTDSPDAARRYEVIAVGAYFCDMVFTGLPDVPQLGKDVFSRDFDIVPGGTFYPAVTLRRLNVNVGWACDFGTDLFSRFMLEAAQAEGIDPGLFRLHDRPVRCVASSFSFEHERGFVSYIEPDLPPYRALAEVEASRPRCLLLPALGFWPDVADYCALPNRADFLILLECQYTDQTLATPGVAEALARVDVFAPNEQEALHFTGESSLDRALDRLAEIAPLVVVKRGGQGALARRGAECVRVPALKVEVVDTTGAGDCFDAGFIYGLVRGESLEMCLRYGNITGGLAVTAPGARAVPREAQVQHIAQHYGAFAR